MVMHEATGSVTEFSAKDVPSGQVVVIGQPSICVGGHDTVAGQPSTVVLAVPAALGCLLDAQT